MEITQIIENLKNRFEVGEISKQDDNFFYITIEKKHLLSALIYMRDTEKFTHFVLLSVVDWLENNKFQLNYFINHPNNKQDICFRVFIDRETAEMESAHDLWEQIATYQRELFEMYGINFPGSPRIDEPFLLEGWDNIPPMRRDFDTKKYAEETFFQRGSRKTKDPAEHMKQKLYPDEKF